ncbi:MAG TPA: PfkB family carbohydrate kinase [Terriglobales bacterium]|nr:PfkB family carbohydrate kinase [Terriglobales bacterium]
MKEPSHVDLVGVGLNAVDTLIAVPRFPARGSKVDSPSIKISAGGQVATSVVACQRWGLRTRYVGKLGDDGGGALHQKEFAQAGVEPRSIVVPGVVSHQSYILVDSDGERTVVCRHDPKLTIQPDELEREWIINARALLVDGYDTKAAIAAATWAREAGIPVIADFDEAYPGIEYLMKVVDYLIVSRNFPERICGERDLKHSLPELQRRFGCSLVAATLGTGGVLGWDGERFYRSQAYRLPVTDTTGAGDIFHAGFIYGLLNGWPLPRQLDFACAAAALNCTGTGARGGIAMVEEIEKLMGSSERYE